MSHHNRKRDFMNYWRLLGYAKPYKWRLTIGILAGFIASSSLFGGLLMIPYLMKGVDPNRPENVAAVEKTATQIVQVMERETEPQEKVKGVSNILAGPQKQMAERIVQSTNKQGATEQEKIKTVASILLTPDNRGELEKKLLAQNAEHKDWACTEEMMKLTKDGKALYLHCLPADISGLSCPEGEVDNSVFDRYLVPLYKQASYKPYIIAAMIFLAQVKDPVKALMDLDSADNKRKMF